MSKSIKTIARAVAFLLVFGFVFISVESVVVPKRDWPVSERRMTKAYRSYYQEQKDSLDFICIGSSFVFSGISPMEIYRQSGLKGYVLAAPGQRAAIGYQLLKAAMATQTPRVVMADIGSLFKSIEANKSTGAWQGSIDSLPLFHIADRLSMTYELSKIRGERFGNAYIERSVLPLLHYHTNYKLESNDFLDLHVNQVYHRKGYVAKSMIRAVDSKAKNDKDVQEDGNDDNEEDDEATGSELDDAVEFNKAYYIKIRDLCRTKNCEFVFIKVPVNAGERYRSNWTEEKHELAQSVADELGVRFLDLNYEDTGLKWATDTPDKGRHLNLSGATKVSKFLSDWLVDNCEFNSDADAGVTARWDYQLDLYDWEMQFYRMQMQTNILEYLSQVREGNNTLIMVVSGGVGDYWNEEMQTALTETMGIEYDLTQNRGSAYLAISDNGKLIEEKNGRKTCELSYRLDDALDCQLKSEGGKNGGAIVVDGVDLSTKSEGIFFAVYNNDLHSIVDCARFNTQKKRLTGTHTNRDYSNDFHLRLMDYCYEALKKM